MWLKINSVSDGYNLFLNIKVWIEEVSFIGTASTSIKHYCSNIIPWHPHNYNRKCGGRQEEPMRANAGWGMRAGSVLTLAHCLLENHNCDSQNTCSRAQMKKLEKCALIGVRHSTPLFCFFHLKILDLRYAYNSNSISVARVIRIYFLNGKENAFFINN